MAKQVSKTVIGGFVISAIAMLIAGVIIIGGGEMFKKTNKYVLFFEKSVKGLSVGSPVIFRGVEVGSVSSIVLQADPQKLSVDVPVMIEVDPSRMRIKGIRGRDLSEQLRRLIQKGLRAQMIQQSFVTGNMLIELDFLPDTPVRLTGLEPGLPEIPTISSGIDKFARELQELPFQEIAGKLLDVLGKLDKVVGDPEIGEMLNHLNGASEKMNRLLLDVDRLVVDANAQVKSLSKGVQSTLSRTQKALKDTSSKLQALIGDAGKLIQNADSQIQPLGIKAQDALVSVRRALDQAKDTLVTMNDFVGEPSDTRHKLNRALDEISAAARSMHSLADYLERHPESLLQGKSGR